MRKGKKKDRGKLKVFLIIAIIVIIALSSAFFVKFAVSGLITGTTYAVKTDIDERVMEGCEQKIADMKCSRWTSCVEGKRSRTCRDLSGCLPYSGHFVEMQDCSVDIKTGSIETGPIIADFCDSDNKCEDNENYILCPKDCSANGKDNLCNDKENGICDPDCGSYDKDCIKFPKATKFSPELSTNFSEFDSFILKNLELGIKEKGTILFKDVVDVSGADLDRHVNINHNMVNVNVKELPELNASARITLFNIVFNETAILFNGKLCKECKIKKFKNGTLIFDVKQMGSYRAEDKKIAEEQFGAHTAKVGGWSLFNTIIIILISILILAGAVYAYMNNYNKKLIKKVEKNKLMPKIGRKLFKMEKEEKKQTKEIGLRPKQLVTIKPFPKIKPRKEKKPAIPIIVVKKKKQKIQKVKPKTIVVKRLTIKPRRSKSKVMFPVSKLPKLKIPKDPYKEERLARQRAAKKRLATMKKNAKKKKTTKKKTKKKTTKRKVTKKKTTRKKKATKRKTVKKKTKNRMARKTTKKKSKKKIAKRKPTKKKTIKKKAKKKTKRRSKTDRLMHEARKLLKS
jgi:hypothetical protein